MLKHLLTMATAGIISCIGLVSSEPAKATSSYMHFGLEVVESAKHQLGLPYVWGGESPRIGFDCSGLIKYTFKEFNVNLPHRADLQYAYGDSVARKDLQKGDMIFFRSGGNWIGHVGIYIGDNHFIHAPHSGAQIQINRLDNSWYSSHYVGAKRIIPEYF